MELIALLYPGFAFACTLGLLALGIGQFWIYKKEGFLRARDLGLFCVFSAAFAFNVVIAHSGAFPDGLFWTYTVVFQFILFAMFYF